MGYRRVAWGSQVAAWDTPKQLALECLSKGLLRHNLDLVVQNNICCFPLRDVMLGRVTSVCNIFYLHLSWVVESVMCQIFHSLDLSIIHLYSSRVRAVTNFGIRAGLPVGNPCYWSMFSLVIVKTILHLKVSYEKLLRIIFTSYLVSL